MCYLLRRSEISALYRWDGLFSMRHLSPATRMTPTTEVNFWQRSSSVPGFVTVMTVDVTHPRTLSCWSKGVLVLQCLLLLAVWAGHWCGTPCPAPDARLCRWVTPHRESLSTWTGWPGTGFPDEWPARPPRWSWCWAGWSDTWGLPAEAGVEQLAWGTLQYRKSLHYRFIRIWW